MTGVVRYILPRIPFLAAVITACLWLILCGPGETSALSPPPGTPVVNRAVAQYADANGNPLPEVSAEVETPLSGGPVLGIQKLESSDPVAMGALLTYTILYENMGNAPATAATVTDTLSGYVVFQSASAGGVYTPGPPGGGTVTWDLGTLAADETGELTVEVRVKTPADFPPGDPDVIEDGTLIRNTATINSNEGPATKTIVTTVGEAPNLEITKSGSPEIIAPGGIITYTLAYQNIGNQPATAVTIRDDLPAGTAYVPGSLTGPGTINGRSLTWELGTIAPGARGEVSFQVQTTSLAEEGDVFRNVYTILSREQGVIPSNEAITYVTNRASLSLTKEDDPDPVRAGLDITYTLRITNDGPVPVRGILIQDAIPDHTTFVSADQGGTFTGSEVLWDLGTLDSGAKAVLHLVVAVDPETPDGEVIQNRATVTSNDVPPLEATAATTVTARTPGVVQFLDASGNSTNIYNIGDPICIQVTDPDQNQNPALRETVTVLLEHSESGDQETVTLTETGPDTGVFQGCIPTAGDPSSPQDGVLTVTPDTPITVTYRDPLDPRPVSQAVALIDPYGVVFDAVTGDLVAGAVVTLYLESGARASTHPLWPPGEPDTVTTGADGAFAFPRVPAGRFYFTVAPGGDYTFPSVVPDAELPPGFVIATGSRGEVFELTVGMAPLNLDVPVDPPGGTLTVNKTANKPIAAVGDMVTYGITVTNEAASPVTAVKIFDTMPHGIEYLQGSTKINGTPGPDPEPAGKRTLIWTLGTLAGGDSLELTYRAVVGPDSPKGDGKNSVYAQGTTVGKTTTSNTARFKIKITGGVFTTKGTILGKVFLDRDGNRVQEDKKGAREPGIPGVVLYLEDGTRVETDEHGKYSVYGIRAGTHVLRLDETTLPEGLEPAPVSNRFMGTGSSQFVDMPQGGLFKANFAVRPNTAPRTIQTIQVSSHEKDHLDYAEQTAHILESHGHDQVRVEELEKYYVVKVGKFENKQEAEAALKAIKKLYPSSFIRETRDGSALERRTVYSSKDKKGREGSQRRQAPVTRQGKASTRVKVEAPPLEEQILKMNRDLAFLNPREGHITSESHINVLLKAPLDAEPTLWVNERPVNGDRIGRKVINRKGRVVIYEFVSVGLLPGEINILRAQVKDPFGNVRGTKEIKVLTVGAPAEIVFTPERIKIPADGKSTALLSLSIRDKQGRPVSSLDEVTVTVTRGEIFNPDNDPATAGLQIPCTQGVAECRVKAPYETGEAELTVMADGIEASAPIFFAPHLRDMLVVGYGEITLGHGKAKGEYDYLKKDKSFDDGFYANGKGAAFVKGRVYKDILLTAAFDSEKEEEEDFFRTRDTDPEAEERYPIYGDESRVGYDALSREKLYVRLDKNKSFLMYGDYDTDLDDTTLSAYMRTFTGLKWDVNTDRLKLKSFASRTDQTQVVDALRGKGTSGYYYLSQRPMVEGSETVVLETRDRYRPEHVLKREQMTRWSDYFIDYDMAGILFKAPVPSHDMGFNPVYVIVSYETEGTGEKYYNYGGRGAVKLTDWLEIGATGITEEKEADNYHLWGTDITFSLPYKTTLRGEWARTESLFDINGIYTPKEGHGWSLELEGRPLDRLSFSAYYRSTSDYFSNLSAFDAMRGAERYGLDARCELTPTTALRAEYFDEEDELNDGHYRRALLGVEKQFRPFKGIFELSHESSNDRYIPPNISTTREPFDISEETPPDDLLAARVGVETQITPEISILVAHKQDIRHNRHNLSEAGFYYQFDEVSRLYVRDEYANYEDRKENRIVMGTESEVAKNTVAFNEYRLGGGIGGDENQMAMGVRNRFMVAEGITGDITIENLRTLEGRQRRDQRDSFAVSTGLEYLPSETMKWTSRLEYRKEETDPTIHSYLAEIGLAYQLNTNHALMLKERYYRDDQGGSPGGKYVTSRTMLGLAYRPVKYDRFNGLAKFEFKNEEDTLQTPNYDTQSYIGSLEGVYQATSRTQLIGKYAGKFEKDGGLHAYTDLVSARILHDLTDRFDVGAEYRILKSHRVGSLLHGGSVEMGTRLVKNLWLSVGYCFDEFDSDLTGDDYQGRGPFVRLRFKFDENTLGRIFGRD